MKAVVTVVGKDRAGIIAKVSGLLFESGINILDISQTIMSDEIFSMIMLVDMRSSEADVVSDKLAALAEELGMSIHLQNEKLFNSMHRI